MQNPLFFDSVPKQLGSFLASLGTFGGLLALIYFAGRGIVGKFMDWHFYVKRETTKHKFELEQQQMVIVFERRDC
jgi:hypothetical protein